MIYMEKANKIYSGALKIFKEEMLLHGVAVLCSSGRFHR
jgi:hypothetical protein